MDYKIKEISIHRFIAYCLHIACLHFDDVGVDYDNDGNVMFAGYRYFNDKGTVSYYFSNLGEMICSLGYRSEDDFWHLIKDTVVMDILYEITPDKTAYKPMMGAPHFTTDEEHECIYAFINEAKANGNISCNYATEKMEVQHVDDN